MVESGRRVGFLDGAAKDLGVVVSDGRLNQGIPEP